MTYAKIHIFALKSENGSDSLFELAKVPALTLNEKFLGSVIGLGGSIRMFGKKQLIIALAGVLAASGSTIAAEQMAPGDIKIEDGALAMSVSGAAGDAVEGRSVFSNRKLGNCLACHAVSDQKEHLFHGEVGPPLDGAADRWNEAELRAIVVNSKAVFSDETVMPGFYSLDVGANVREDLVGKTILTAQQIEDVVAYLATLKE